VFSWDWEEADGECEDSSEIEWWPSAFPARHTVEESVKVCNLRLKHEQIMSSFKKKSGAVFSNYYFRNLGSNS